VQVTAITTGAPLVGGRLAGSIATRYVRTFTDDLVRAGAHIVESSEPVHAKLVQVDDELIAGSWNLTRQGAERDGELVVRTGDPGIVRAARDVIDELDRNGRPVRESDVDGRLHRVVDAVFEGIGFEY
jgi:phosphatidylserine/phosphatidylglycerophosphate/cardiolipin synthase-like enzyme